jgi:hypothetical protein
MSSFLHKQKKFWDFLSFSHFREENFLNLRYIIKPARANADKKFIIRLTALHK